VAFWPLDGELVDGEPHGRGILILQTGRYEGEFHNGKPNGAGRLTDVSGPFQGNWTDGCFREGTKMASFGVPPSSCR
jgi:hypothetical protein